MDIIIFTATRGEIGLG